MQNWVQKKVMARWREKSQHAAFFKPFRLSTYSLFSWLFVRDAYHNQQLPRPHSTINKRQYCLCAWVGTCGRWKKVCKTTLMLLQKEWGVVDCVVGTSLPRSTDSTKYLPMKTSSWGRKQSPARFFMFLVMGSIEKGMTFPPSATIQKPVLRVKTRASTQTAGCDFVASHKVSTHPMLL